MRSGRSGTYVALVLVVLTLAYGLFQARTLIGGPQLVVLYPTPGATVSGPVYTVRGTAHNISRVRINGRPITTDLSGGFAETLVTPDGYGVIVVEAENRLKRYASERIEIVGIREEDDQTEEEEQTTGMSTGGGI